MIDKATSNINEIANYAEFRKEFFVMNAQDLNFQSDRFTHVGCMFGIMFFPYRPKGLSEMHRVLKPGGMAAIGTWKNTELLELTKQFADYLDAADGKEESCSVAMTEMQKLAAICSDPEQFTLELTAVGFTEVEIVCKESTFHLPNEESFYYALALNPVMKECMGGRTVEETYPHWQAFLQSEASQRRWFDAEGKIRMCFVANIAIARKAAGEYV